MNNESSQKFANVIAFCQKLEQSKTAVWKDRFGEYRVSFEKKALEDRAINHPGSFFFISENVERYLDSSIRINEIENSNTVFSIGSFQTHNSARLYCMETHKRLITIPVPLTNDSFGTNRVQFQKAQASQDSIFPVETIFDLDIFQNVPLSTNMLGVGECIGFYFSIIDYYQSRNQSIPDNILDYTLEKFHFFSITPQLDLRYFYQQLSINLVYKCLIMRVNEDHQIGCGIDHLIGGVLEKKIKLPHGEAVFIGGIIAFILFPEWEQFGLSMTDLVTFGKRNRWLTKDVVDRVLDLDFRTVLTEAIVSRPNRPSMLRNLSLCNFGNVWEKIILLTK